MSFKDISLDITEDEYRNDGAYHYSTLSTYERGGVHSIPTLKDRKESPSLLFGSLVDTLITGPEDFDKLYFVADFPDITDVFINVIKGLHNIYSDRPSLNDIEDNIILSVLDEVGYGKSWKAATRVSKLREAGTEYYRLLHIADNKQIVSSATYSDAVLAVNALREAPATKFLFAEDNNPSIERCYQLKFSGRVNYINSNTYTVLSHNSWESYNDNYLPYSCMADLILVLHDKKKVIPVDLKTSSHYEDEFYQSFVDWNYHIQARLYWHLIRAAMDDSQYKDYTLDDYHFVVVNKKSLTPLVWKFEDTQSMDTLYYGKNKQIELRHPFVIGKELHNYLQTGILIDKDVLIDKPNSLTFKLNQL